MSMWGSVSEEEAWNRRQKRDEDEGLRMMYLLNAERRYRELL